MNMIQATVQLARPKTLIASISPVMLAASWALAHHVFKAPLFLLLISSALMLQILANIANDYFDGLKGADLHRIGPQRLTSNGQIGLTTIKTVLGVVFLICLLLGITLSYQGGAVIGALFGLALILAIIYTAGPFALCYRGIAEPFAFSFFGPIPTLCASYLFSSHLHLTPCLLGCLPGLYSLILITINNLRDLESDKIAQKNTLIVKKGRDFGKKMIAYALVTQIVLTLVISLDHPLFLLSLISLPEVCYFFVQIKKSQTPQEFAPLLGSCAKLYLTSTILWMCFIMI
jgi:1,4-dihydroxy-2-naphthoate octaprenyltransferase